MKRALASLAVAWRNTTVPAAATAALAVLLLVQAGSLLARLRPHLQERPSVAPARTADAPPSLDVVLAADLFGKAAKGSASLDPDAPATQAPLTLTGIVARADPRRGLAILGPSAADSRLYRTGAELSPGLWLVAVYADRVLLDHEGAAETLRLVRSARAPLAAVASAESLAVVPLEPTGVIGGVINPQPVHVGGVLQGYRLVPGADANAFAKLGLRSGDLLVSIDGTRLDDPTRGPAALAALAASSLPLVKVMRNGSERDLTLPMSEAAHEAEANAALRLQMAGVQDPIMPGRATADSL